MANEKRKFYTMKKIHVLNGNVIGRLDIYGDIDSNQFWGDETTPSTFTKELNALGKINEIELHIFSNGGDMFASLAIYDILKSRPERKTAYVEGCAASGGTVIICACDLVYMSNASMLFVHLAMSNSGLVNENGARQFLGDLEKYKEPMIAAYMAKSKKTREEIIALMNGVDGNGVWMTADEAIAFGLANAITPEAKLPLEAAASIAPGIYNYKGHQIDLTMFNKAAEKTAGKIISMREGGKTMAFFRMRKKNPAAKVQPKPKAEIVFTETVCPSCGGAVNLNTETGEVIAGQTNGQPAEAQEPAEKTFARLMPSNVMAALFTVTCPHCGSEYVWDTDVNQDGSDGTETQETVPLGGNNGQQTEPAAPAQSTAAAPANTAAPGARLPAKPKAALPAKPKAELATAICPGCGVEITYDTATTETGTDTAGTEGYVITCPDCATQFVEPLVAASPASIPVGTNAQAAYRMGVQAERQRILALNEMSAAAPEAEEMIQAAIRSGSSVEAMSRNIFKTLAANKTDRSRNSFIQSLERDVEASGVNNLRKPQIHNKQAAFAEGVLTALDNR